MSLPPSFAFCLSEFGFFFSLFDFFFSLFGFSASFFGFGFLSCYAFGFCFLGVQTCLLIFFLLYALREINFQNIEKVSEIIFGVSRKCVKPIQIIQTVSFTFSILDCTHSERDYNTALFECKVYLAGCLFGHVACFCVNVHQNFRVFDSLFYKGSPIFSLRNIAICNKASQISLFEIMTHSFDQFLVFAGIAYEYVV